MLHFNPNTEAAKAFEDKLCTNAETAEILSVHPKSLVRARVYGGPLSELPHVRVGRNIRYRLSDIERFLRANTAKTVHEHALV